MKVVLRHPGGRNLELFPRIFSAADSSIRLLVLVAHPDDEVIGASSQVPHWASATYVHLTDGAPRKIDDAAAAGFSKAGEYRAARRREAETALGLGGVEPAQIRSLGFTDQEASFHLEQAVEAVLALLHRLAPEAILTHSYEGGHPDHDATAFAAHTACELLKRNAGIAPALFELTSYHNRAGIMQTGEFLSHPDTPPHIVWLSPEQRDLKRRMFDCFASQRKVLAYFPVEKEAFRPSPRYDFGRPPHEGLL